MSQIGSPRGLASLGASSASVSASASASATTKTTITTTATTTTTTRSRSRSNTTTTTAAASTESFPARRPVTDFRRRNAVDGRLLMAHSHVHHLHQSQLVDSPSLPTSQRGLPSIQSSQTPRSLPSRPTIPSPLTTLNLAAASSTLSAPSYSTLTTTDSFQEYRRRGLACELKSQGKSVPSPAEFTTFFSDSSEPSSPDDEKPSQDFSLAPNDSRTSPRAVTFESHNGQRPSSPTTMASTIFANLSIEASSDGVPSLPRNASIDSAISAVSSIPQANGSTGSEQLSHEMARLIKTAGTPEAAIQHLLKEKQSQTQQNNQLWRLVDKQRAMILGLNKDLEAALKDKERYRKKLKEVMASATIIKTPIAQPDESKSADQSRETSVLRADFKAIAEPVAASPTSPKLDSDSQLASPIDLSLAPYPITPPADRNQPPASIRHGSASSAQERGRDDDNDHTNHGADSFMFSTATATVESAKEKTGERMRETPPSLTLAPIRSLPSEPPNMPPPNPPSPLSPPIVNVMEPTPQPNEGITKFPSPPRKGPPAPLQLKQEIHRHLRSSSIDEDTDSDYDDILDVEDVVPFEKRGRRRTREEDDRERELLAIQEAEARSASKKSKSSKGGSPNMDALRTPPAMPSMIQQELASVSLNAVLNGGKPTRELAPPLLSPGLPASPRPFGNVKMTLGAAPPLSPRGAAPLSPRPPRQPIPLPPNTPLAPPPGGHAAAQSAAVARNTVDAQQSGHAKSQSTPIERTKIYRGLVTEEYPDLLLPPNALPSIDVQVASSRMKPSRASLMSLTQLEEDPVFTLAVYSRIDRRELWRVEKDSASLMKLDQRMKHSGAFTGKTPDRTLFTGHAPAKLDARRFALDQYMDELLNAPLDTTTAIELCKYLSTNVLPPNADEIGSTSRQPTDPKTDKADNRGRSGYLTKKGKNFGGWKARFFILEGPYLKYYETPGGTHLGTIKLQYAQIGKQSPTSEFQQPPSNQMTDEDLDNQYRHAFLILEPKKKDSANHVRHVLCAESDKERDLWVDSLVQWTEQKALDEPLPSAKFGTFDRQMPGGQSNSSGKAKKNENGKTHQSSGSDTLIGVRYDATNAGEAPQSTPNGRPKTSGGVAEHQPLGDVQQKIISGPKDPQIISDSAAWGNRAAPAAPTHDEKKQRKRSFFGFGPKARSSSDGQESMFGGSENGVSPTPPPNSYQGPVRQVFGAPLGEAVRYNAPLDVQVSLPSVLYRCIQYLESQNAVLEEGIFRLSGSNIVIKQLRERFNTEGDVNLVTDEQYYDIHAVASLLKLYLRELPTSILTRDLHLEFLATTEVSDRNEKLTALRELTLRLPEANATLLKYLIAFLIRIINNADANKMTARNVGIVFSPTLNIPAPVFAVFLQNYEAIFGIDPEEYELPSPVSDSDTQARSESVATFEPPGRPSTSSGSASPLPQTYIESIRDQSRSTPTPPLLVSLNAARGSPTPSGASHQSHEPSHLPGTRNVA